MDEGLAAVIAAACGLVGAAIGGCAAVWGARIGARMTSEALLRQVEAQARAEHGLWRRQGRHDAYEAFIAALHDMLETLLAWRRSAALAPAGSRVAPPDAYSDARDAVMRTGFRVEVAGPERLQRLADRAHDQLSVLAGLLDEADQARSSDGERRWDEAVRRCSDSLEAFTAAARQVLDEPTVTG